MKLEKLVGERFKERPSDCAVDSHALMVRGGYIKYVANGIFSSYTPQKRIARKIDEILREEMDAIDGQEVAFPVVMRRAVRGERVTVAGELKLCRRETVGRIVEGGAEAAVVGGVVVIEYGCPAHGGKILHGSAR